MKNTILMALLFFGSVSQAGQVQVFSKHCNRGKVGTQNYSLRISKPNSNNEVNIVLDLSEDGRVTLIGQYGKNESDWYVIGKTEIKDGQKFVEVSQVFYGEEKATSIIVGTGSDEDQSDGTACSRH